MLCYVICYNTFICKLLLKNNINMINLYSLVYLVHFLLLLLFLLFCLINHADYYCCCFKGLVNIRHI